MLTREKLVLLLLAAGALAALVSGLLTKPPQTTPPTRSRTKTVEGGAQPKVVLGRTIGARFAPPAGWNARRAGWRSFGAWLADLPLKDGDAKPLRHDGKEAPNVYASAAVVDMSPGRDDIMRGPQSVFRLHAEFLASRGKARDVRIPLKDGGVAEFKRWAEGERLTEKEGKVTWGPGGERGDSHEALLAFLDAVLPYTDAKCLETATKEVGDVMSVQPGDVFVRPERQAAAVVVGVADEALGSLKAKAVLLVHGSEPAQEMHVIANIMDEKMSPWFVANYETDMMTPEGPFKPSQLRRF